MAELTPIAVSVVVSSTEVKRRARLWVSLAS
jgi:hypothetical protein